MKTARVIVSSAEHPTPGSLLSLEKEELHHLKHVLRLANGAPVEAIIPELRLIARTFLDGTALRVEDVTPSPPPAPLHLVVGIPEAPVGDTIVEKCVELGVRSITFFGGERSQGVRIQDLEKRRTRFSRVAMSAAKQCRTAYLPTVEFVPALPEFLIRLAPDSPPGIRVICVPPDPTTREERSLFAHLFRTSHAPPIRGDNTQEILGKSTPSPTPSPLFPIALEEVGRSADFILIIGSEGGLTLNERNLAKEHGFQEASLGVNTLRSETAVVVACGLVCMATRD